MAKRLFSNLDGSGAQPFGNVVRWALVDRVTGKRNHRKPGEGAPAVTPDLAALKTPPPPGKGVRLTWLGHASWLVQLDGVSLLIDPVLGRSISGFVRRYAPLPIGVPELPAIDAQLVTHNHRDHLDLPTVKKVGAPVIAGLANARYFARGKCRELDWWQSATVGPVTITFVPSQHWSNRGWDINQALWGGFVIESTTGARVYHSGDTAWFDGFAEIGRRFPTLDAALLPIGAYEPEWFMRRQHMNPEDAINAFVALGARACFPMHWGTYQLTDEALAEPPAMFRRLWQERALPESAQRFLAIGESAVV